MRKQNSVPAVARSAPPDPLPPAFDGWFRSQGWSPYPHQLAMVEAARANRHALLIAPTGAGKTLSGFLPSLIDLAETPRPGLHTLYLSPLKALAVDVHRNLETPLAQLRLPIRAETRTGDTPEAKRQRQRKSPPNILMTTPESLALLLSYGDAPSLFRNLAAIVIDELHALVESKRGDLLALGLARLASLAPRARRVGLSATVADETWLTDFLAPHGDGPSDDVDIVRGRAGAEASIHILTTRQRLPWSGHMALHAMDEVYEKLRGVKSAIVFVNTRAQAELAFQRLWDLNEDNLAIALHHGSLAAEQRRKVEAAMAAGKLRAVVATSSLDLGIDWGDVELVIQIGAPKGAARLLQRIGRANHRLDVSSEALLVPANRFEFLECLAAMDAVAEHTLDGNPRREGGLDVLAQHMTGMAVAGGFHADALYAEVRRAAPYRALPRATFDATLDFAATGGYALKSYEQFRKLARDENGVWKPAFPRIARQYRMNVGTIVEEPMVKIRLNRGKVLGEVEEYFVSQLVEGDTFIFAGRLLTFLGLSETTANCASGGKGEPKVPAYAGGRLPLSTHLAERVRRILASPPSWAALPEAVQEWLELQRWASVLPSKDGLLVETFPRGEKHFMVAYCFEGRNAHQTLGMLLTRRMERMKLKPLGFVATDYVIATWSLREPRNLDALFAEDMLGDDLEEWMAESSLLKRTFRTVATIAGLIERRHPGQEKSGRQMTVSSDLIYDVLRKHQPDHVLLQATRAEAAQGLTDIGRLAAMLKRVKGRITHRALDRVSPLAVPVLLEIGRESVYGEAMDALLEEAEATLVAEAMGSGGGPVQARLSF
jgi:ATP-dependent Lhr-like helicase